MTLKMQSNEGKCLGIHNCHQTGQRPPDQLCFSGEWLPQDKLTRSNTH